MRPRARSSIARRQLISAGIAKFTGGWDEGLETPAQPNDVYSRILSNMNELYVIGYFLTNEVRKDGKRRAVRIELKKNSNFGIWGENRISRRAHDRKIL